MESELKPCPNPWCEAAERDGDFSPLAHRVPFGNWRVSCSSCCMRGPTKATEAESFAAHRQAAERAERDRIVAWLRKQSATALAHDLAVFDTYAERKALEMMADLQEREADAIEAGEHLK